MADTLLPNHIESCRSINMDLISSSVHKYINYSKQMQIRLAEINDNVSSVIKESCTGIDNICNKVRQCLTNMGQRENSMHFTDEVTEYEIIDEEIKCGEEYSQDNDSQYNDEALDNESSIESLQQNKQCAAEQSAENVQTITPFFTLINCQSKEDSNKTETCKKQVLTKTIYSLMDKENSSQSLQAETELNFEYFKETVTTLCENFDMMNKLVEDINREIEQFSQTALTTKKTSLQEIDTKETNREENRNETDTSTPKLKPIKRLSKCNSRQKSIQVGDSMSENEIDLELMELSNKDSNSFIIPDVYRKRAFTDLYQRLVAQVEANDSLMFFQTLMKRQKKLEKKSNKNGVSQIKLNVPVMNYSVSRKSTTNTLSQRQSSKKLELDKKYPGSLWFSQKQIVKEKSGTKSSSRKRSRREFVSKKTSSRVIENKSQYPLPMKVKSRTRKTKVSDSTKSLLQPIKNDPTPNSLADVTRKACSLECTCRMVVKNDMPPSPSTKCHLQWLRAKPHVRNIKFLDILDDLTHKDLLPLQSEYPRRDNHRPRELDYKDIQDTYLYKLLYGKQGTKNAWKLLLEPSLNCSNAQFSKKNCSVSKTQRLTPRKKEEKTNNSFMEKFSTQNYSKSDIFRKLSRYMFDPEKQEDRYSRTVIVMPVRVYYDNLKSNEPPTKLRSLKPPVGTVKKTSLSTPREVKEPKKAPGFSKPMKVVYDGLSNKPQVAPTTTVIKTPIIPSNPPISGRANSEKISSKNDKSRLFSPKSFGSYSQDTANVTKEPTDVKSQENTSAYSNIQAEFNKIKKDMYDKKFTYADKRLWSSKYGKTVGQQLISYVQHQEPEATRPLPKYAIPKLKIHSTLPEKQNVASFLKEVNPHRQILSHVRNLKTKNDEIQDNIKKAIDVIEAQMVDILHSDSNSIEAFDIMEKEITSVLSLMKCNGNRVLKTIPSKSCITSKDNVESNPKFDLNSLETDYKIISDQLFDRLQKILDTGGSSVPSTPPEGMFKRKHHHHKKEKDEMRKKQKLTSSKRNKINTISSSTSASMDEKIYIKRSPRQNSKKTEKVEIKSKSAIISEPINNSKWEHNCGDQNIINDVPVESENSVSEHDIKCTNENNPKPQMYEDQTWENSEGDFSNHETDFYYDVETDNITIDKVISDDRVEKLIITEEIPKISDLSIFHTEMEEFIKDELNKAIEEAEIHTPIINTEIEGFITDELNKAIKKVETFATPSDADLARHSIDIEMEEFIDSELDNAIAKAEATVESLSNINLNDYTADTGLKEFIDVELNKAIKKAETLATVPNSPEIEDARNHIISAEIQEFLDQELDKAITNAERLADTKEGITAHIITEMKEFINKKLCKAITNAETMATVSEIRKFITEELNAAIKKAEKLVEIPDCEANTNDQKSPEEKDFINQQEELNKVITNVETLTTVPDFTANIDNHEPDRKENLLDSIVKRGEQMCAEKLRNEIISNTEYLTRVIKNRRSRSSEPLIVDERLKQNECNSPDYSDQVHKIIRRVEDIYLQLEDIQNSDSIEKVPVFKDTEIPDVHSEMFLTPFMHAVKETRNNSNEANKDILIEKSPSYYNVMNFLDTINNIQKETPYEIYVARLHHYVYIYQETMIYYQIQIWHEAEYTPPICSERSSCLKSNSQVKNDVKPRKVCFSQTFKEDKSNQVTLCPFHKIKAIRISSQQFPPLQQSKETLEKVCSAKNHGNVHTETKKASECTKNRCCAHKNKDLTLDKESNRKLCKIHGDTGKTSEAHYKRERKHCAKHERNTKHVDCCEKTTKHQLSVIDDKSTQVFCQMQKENSCERSVAEENDCVTSSSNEQSAECLKYVESNPDDSKSTDKDFLDNSLVDPFYDYVNDTVNTKATEMQEGSKSQVKITVYKKVTEDQSLLQPEGSVINSSDIELYKKKLEKRREIRLMRKSSVDIARQKMPKVHRGSENVVLLKSFYAIVYILVFTALSLDYRCL